MVLTQAISFLYNAQLAGLSAERSNLDGPLILNALVSWTYSDRLNKLKVMRVIIEKASVDRSKVFFERDVFVPGFNFIGIITGINDINDSLLAITMHERAWHFTRRIYKIGDGFKEYNLVLVNPADLATELQAIITSANTDMPYDWVLGEDIPATADYDFDIKWKTYYQVLQQTAIKTANDVWFEGVNIVKFGTKGRTIELDKDDKIYEKLSTKIDLDTYANIVNLVGGEVAGNNVFAQATAAETDLLYNYERVVSNNNLKDQGAVDVLAPVILADFDSTAPDVSIDINEDFIHKYKLESGDIIKISANSETQTVKGFYRVVDIIVSSDNSKIKLQFSKSGKFIPRISDSLDILEAVLTKLHDIELNS